MNFIYSIYAFSVHSQSIWAHCSAALTHTRNSARRSFSFFLSFSLHFYLTQYSTTHICTYFTVLCHYTLLESRFLFQSFSLALFSCSWYYADVASQVCYYVISGYFKFFYKLYQLFQLHLIKWNFFGSIQVFSSSCVFEI